MTQDEASGAGDGSGDGAGPIDADEPPAERSRATRIALIAGLLVVAGLWSYALVYSVVRKDPERLTSAEHSRIEHACTSAITQIRHLPPVTSPPTNSKVAQRARAETAVLAAMVAELHTIQPQRSASAEAFGKWLDDWGTLLAARRAYAREVLTQGTSAELVVPAANGTAISVRMNRYAESKFIEDCDTTALGAENVNGLAKGA